MRNSFGWEKAFVIFSLIQILCLRSFAVDFAKIPDISSEQKNEIEKITSLYKPIYDAANKHITVYRDKSEAVGNDEDKTEEQKQILINAYKRTTDLYEKQLEQVKLNTEEAYRKILTPEQYEIYESLSDTDNKFIENITE